MHKCRTKCAMMHLTYFSTKINRQMYEYIKDFDELELEMKCLRLYAHNMVDLLYSIHVYNVRYSTIIS